MADEGQVARKVYFFRIEHFGLLKDKLPNSLKTIASLPFHSQGRYQQDISENVLLSVYPDSLSYPLRLKFGRTRRDLLPDVERGGELEILNLDEEAGLIDVCHIIIFDDGHVASEFNQDGPRIKKLGDYLYLKGKGLPHSPNFLPLFQRNIVEVLLEIDAVRILEIEVPPDTSALIRQADDNLADAIEASQRAGSVEKVCLELVGNASSGARLKELARRLAEMVKANPSDRRRFLKLKASGYVGGSKVKRFVDILEEKMISGEIFTRKSGKSRSIDSADAFRVIERAYNLRKDKLADAACGNELWP